MRTSMFTVHTRTKICSYFINLIFIIKKFMNLMYNPSFIGFLQHVRWINASPVSCTFAVIISVPSFGHASFTKLALFSLQNSRCKYSPMPSEFQFKEPPLPSEFQKAIHRGVWIFSGITHWVQRKNGNSAGDSSQSPLEWKFRGDGLKWKYPLRGRYGHFLEVHNPFTRSINLLL